MSVDELINALPDTRDKNNYIKQTAKIDPVLD